MASLHWSERERDTNISIIGQRSLHINRPRMSSQTIFNLLTLKAKLLGKRLDILQEAREFEERNSL